MQKMQQGFTLIELMIVVAIIGILAAIAIPQYSEYQARAKVAAGLGEISGGKTGFEYESNQGTVLSTASQIGLAANTTNCTTIDVTATTIQCTNIRNAPTQVSGKNITWTRDATTGAWTCATTAEAKYAPKSCPGV